MADFSDYAKEKDRITSLGLFREITGKQLDEVMEKYLCSDNPVFETRYLKQEKERKNKEMAKNLWSVNYNYDSYNTLTLSNTTVKQEVFGEKINRSSVTPERIIFQDNETTVVYWKDGTKTIVHTMEGDQFIPEVGVAMAIVKKLFPIRNKFKDLVDGASVQVTRKNKK